MDGACSVCIQRVIYKVVLKRWLCMLLLMTGRSHIWQLRVASVLRYLIDNQVLGGWYIRWAIEHIIL